MLHQQVVPMCASAADGRGAIQTSMRSVAVVLKQPARQMLLTMLGSGIGVGVGPFAQCSLDEALGLAVSAGSVGSSADVGDAVVVTSSAEGTRLVTRAVIGEHAADPDAELVVEGQGSEEEGRSRNPFLIK